MKTQLLFFISFLLIGTSCKQTSNLNFPGIKVDSAQHMGKGVWIKVPYLYKEAKSYDGFQASNYESSISLKVDRGATLEDRKRFFDKAQLSLKKQKMVEMTTFPFGESETALYTIVEDKRKRTFRYQLAIQKGDDAYRITAFCPKHLHSKYKHLITAAFQSASFGEEREKQEAFVMAQLVSLNETIFTRDGLFPTESEDQAIINLKLMKTDSIPGFDVNKREYLENQMKRLSEDKIEHGGAEMIGDGDFRTAKIRKGDTKIFGALICANEGEETLVMAQTKDEAALKEINLFVRRMFISTDISWG